MTNQTSMSVFCAICFLTVTSWADKSASYVRDKEQLTLRVTNKDGQKYTGTLRFKVEKSTTGEKVSYEYEDPDAHWQVDADPHGIPVKISYKSRDGETIFTFDRKGKVTATGTWKGEHIEEKDRFTPNVTAENMFVLKSLPINDDTPYDFDLIQTDKLPKLKVYPMSFARVGKAAVTVPAGTFNCLKVRFTFSDWRRFFWEAFYYVTDDDRRIVVKIENIPDGGMTELVKIE